MKKYYFGNEQMDAAAQLARELLDEATPDLTTTENMVNSLSMRSVSGDAEQVVSGLLSGIDTFHNLYKKAHEREVSEVVKAELDRITEGLSKEDKKIFLMGILNAYAATVGHHPAEDPECEPEVLKEAISIYFSEYSMVNLNIAASEILANMDEKGICRIVDALQQEQQEGYVALAMYLLKITGENAQIPDNMRPEEIGAVTAASLVAQKSFIEMAQGKIDFDSLFKVLKVISGILMLALVAIVAYHGLVSSAICVAAGLRMFTIVSSLGGMMLAAGICFMGIVALSAVASAALCGGGVIVVQSGIADAVIAMVQKTNAYIAETLIPAAQRFWNSMKGSKDTDAVDVSESAEAEDAEHVDLADEAVETEEEEEVGSCYSFA